MTPNCFSLPKQMLFLQGDEQRRKTSAACCAQDVKLLHLGRAMQLDQHARHVAGVDVLYSFKGRQSNCKLQYMFHKGS